MSFESRRAKEIAHLISSNGGVPTVAPSTRDVPEDPDKDELLAIRRILAQEFDTVIFMTGVGARALIDAASRVSTHEEFLMALARTKVVVRGPKPAAVMREFGVPIATTVPEPNTWAEVVQALDSGHASLRGRRIAVQEHGEPSPELYTALGKRGAEVFPVHVYHWALPEDTGPLKSAIQALIRNEIDIVMFTASVQFTHAERVAQEMGWRKQFVEALRQIAVASIGPTTSETLRGRGIRVDFEPSHPKMGFLVKELAERSAELVKSKAAG